MLTFLQCFPYKNGSYNCTEGQFPSMQGFAALYNSIIVVCLFLFSSEESVCVCIDGVKIDGQNGGAAHCLIRQYNIQKKIKKL